MQKVNLKMYTIFCFCVSKVTLHVYQAQIHLPASEAGMANQYLKLVSEKIYSLICLTGYH